MSKINRDTVRTDDIRPEMDERTLSMQRARERMREIEIDDRMNPEDILYFPIEKVPYGWIYKWVRVANMEVPDLNHEHTVLKQGWSPVPAARHPEEARNHLAPTNVNSEVIIRRGLMLCEIPMEANKKIEGKRSKMHIEEVKSLGGAVEKMPSDPTVPRGVITNTDDYSHLLGTTFGH
jgi:hypothetical protein